MDRRTVLGGLLLALEFGRETAARGKRTRPSYARCMRYVRDDWCRTNTAPMSPAYRVCLVIGDDCCLRGMGWRGIDRCMWAAYS